MTDHSDQRRAVAKMMTLAFLVCMLCSLAARIWAVRLMIDSAGPTHIAAASGMVYVHVNDLILEVSGDGQLIRQHTAVETDLKGGLIDIRALSDGRLLLAEQRPTRLRLCDPQDWSCQEIGVGLAEGITRQLKVLPIVAVGAENAFPGNLLITEARSDALWLMGDGDTGLKSLLPPGTLSGPNDLAFAADGGLWIADTDNRRVVEWLLSDNGSLEQGRQLFAVNELTREARYYPIMLAADPMARWWVTQASEFTDGSADVLINDPDKGAIARVDLPEGGFPTDLVLNGDDMLVSDLEAIAVYAVDIDSLAVRPFGDRAFVQVMESIRQRRDRLDLLTSLALAGVLVFATLMLVAAVVATQGSQRFIRRPMAINFESGLEVAPVTTAVHWLNKNPVQVRAEKLISALIFVAPLLGLGAGLAMIAWLKSSGLNEATGNEGFNAAILLVVFFTVMLLSGLGYLLYTIQKSMRRRLGSDGRKIWLGMTDGSSLKVDPEEIAHNGRVLFYRRYAMILMNGKGQAVYRSNEVDQWITPLLRGSEKYNAWQSLRHQWRYRDPQIIAAIAMFAGLGVVAIMVALLKHSQA